MPSAAADGITMINFAISSPNSATIMDLLSAIMPKAVLFLGKCGGLKRKNRFGDLVLPIAAIHGEGTSDETCCLKSPRCLRSRCSAAVSTMIRDLGRDHWTGTVCTNNRRLWEHHEAFKARLPAMRCMAIDMETATVFAARFGNHMRCCSWATN
jgi:AMP nucleosidase